jgi:RNA-directed DNA polymerase
MMYDHEKSDSAIVAVKPTNKAGQPAAELVEPRAEAEGNVSQQSTGRAQYRGIVSQALERVRQVARQRKKEKFTALFHHVSIDHLEEAFSVGHRRKLLDAIAALRAEAGTLAVLSDASAAT